MKQGTYYLTEDEHREFKAKCAADGVSITDKIKALILGYTSNSATQKNDNKKTNSF